MDSAPISPASPRYKWLVVGMLWFICFFNYADRLAIFSVFPLLQKELGFSKTQLGLIGAAFTWVYALTAPFAGHIGDKMPRKWVILGGLYIWSLVTGLTAQCTKVFHFVLVRGAEGLGETFYFPASMALISDYHSPKTRSRAIGLHQTSIYAGTIGGGALAGWMGEKYGWYSPFWVLAGAGIVLGVILQRFIREPQRNQAERAERALTQLKSEQTSLPPLPIRQFLRAFVRTKTAVLLVSAYFGANLVGLVFLTWMPTFLTEKFHLKLAVAGLGATLFIQLASMAGSVLGGVIADRWSQSRASGRILVQAVAALLGAPFIVLCGWTRDPWVLILAMSCFGLCKGMYDSNLTAAFYDVISPSRRSTATGLMNLLGWLGAGLGSLVIGVAVDHGVTMSAAISSTGLIYLAVAATLFAAAHFTAHTDIAAAREAHL